MKDTYRKPRGFSWTDDVVRDVAYAVRTFVRNPAFASVAAITLALGIGANTALFSIIDALMLKKLNVAEPDELAILMVDDGDRPPYARFSYPFYEDVRESADRFSGVAASMGDTSRQITVVGRDGNAETVSVNADGVTGNYFSVLGVRAILGRTLVDTDDRREDPQPVVVLSHAFWSSRFGSDAAVLGRAIVMSDVPHTIVGVAPPGFYGIEVGASPDLWFPLRMLPRVDGGPNLLGMRRSEWLKIVGRVRTDIARPAAQAQLRVLYERNHDEEFRSAGGGPGPGMTSAQRDRLFRRTLLLQPGATGETELREQYGRPLLILMIVVGIVLLVTCANVANLLLARAMSRQKEIALRMAIGADRSRLVRQLLTESVLLAAIGGALGLLVAVWVSRALLAFVPDPATTLGAGLDLRVLAFTALVSMLTGLLFGVSPALSMTNRSLLPASVGGDRVTAGGRRLTLHNGLVVSQVALSVVVLVAGGLFLRTLQNLQQLELGFEQDRLTVFRLVVPVKYTPARRADVYRGVADRLETLPETDVVSFSMFGLLSNMNRTIRVAVPGYTPGSDEDTRSQVVLVGPRFFEATGTRILAGRGFSNQDEGPARRVVVNQAFARRFYSGSPVGERFAEQGFGQPFEIIGVVADTKYRALRESSIPTMYAPYGREAGMAPPLRVQVEMRTSTDGAVSEEVIRRAVRDVDPAAAVSDVRSMREVVDRTISQERLLATLGSLFGVLALVLASIGLYGVRSFAVSSRTNEIGIRMALGATRGVLLRSILSQGIVLASIGIAVGTAVSVQLTTYVGSVLYELTPRDPPTYVAVAILFVMVATLASYVPARRATKIDPLAALRRE